MLNPKNRDIQSYIGADFFDTFYFWQRTIPPNTTPFDFTGWSLFTMTIGDMTLTEANDGLVVVSGSITGSGDDEVVVDSTISASIARAITAGFSPGSMAYNISALDEYSKLNYLMIGNVIWKAVL